MASTSRLLNSANIRTILLSALLLLASFACSSTLTAQIRGEYSPGSTLSGAGSVPDPGFSYSNQLWLTSADRLYADGALIPVKAQLNVVTENNSVIYVPNFRLLGGRPEFVLCIAISNGRLAAIDPLNKQQARVNGVGLSNTNFVPWDIGWRLERVDLQAGLSAYAPTGSFNPAALNNVNSGFWTLGPQLGATINLTSNKATQISVYNFYAWNSVQKSTGIRAGQNDSLDYSLTHTFSVSKGGKWSLQAGAAGYGQWQTTPNQGQPPARERLLYGIDGIGFTTNLSSPYKGLYAGVSVLFEYAARNTYEGRTTVITAGLNF